MFEYIYNPAVRPILDDWLQQDVNPCKHQAMLLIRELEADLAYSMNREHDLKEKCVMHCACCGAKTSPYGATDKEEFEAVVAHILICDKHPIKKLKAANEQACLENSFLRAAIGTPEVYAGIITQVLEQDRDKVMQENAALEARLEAAEKVVGRLRSALHLAIICWGGDWTHEQHVAVRAANASAHDTYCEIVERHHALMDKNELTMADCVQYIAVAYESALAARGGDEKEAKRD
jgi:hypothetical protein